MQKWESDNRESSPVFQSDHSFTQSIRKNGRPTWNLNPWDRKQERRCWPTRKHSERIWKCTVSIPHSPITMMNFVIEWKHGSIVYLCKEIYFHRQNGIEIHTFSTSQNVDLKITHLKYSLRHTASFSGHFMFRLTMYICNDNNPELIPFSILFYPSLSTCSILLIFLKARKRLAEKKVGRLFIIQV